MTLTCVGGAEIFIRKLEAPVSTTQRRRLAALKQNKAKQTQKKKKAKQRRKKTITKRSTHQFAAFRHVQLKGMELGLVGHHPRRNLVLP
jgi:hypothetical protein